MANRKNKEDSNDQSTPEQPSAPASTPTSAPSASPQQDYDAFQTKLKDMGITLSPQQFKSVGLNVTVAVPTSVADFDRLANKEGECLAQGVKNIVYRGALAVFRARFCDALEAKTGIARKFTAELNADGSEKKDAEGNVVVKTWEPEAVYVKRVAGDSPEQYQGLADSISATLTFDPTAPEPKAPGTKKMAAVYLTTANQIYDRDGSAEKVIAGLASKLGLTVAPQEVTDGTDREARVAILAGLIKEDQNRKKLVDLY